MSDDAEEVFTCRIKIHESEEERRKAREESPFSGLAQVFIKSRDGVETRTEAPVVFKDLDAVIVDMSALPLRDGDVVTLLVRD